MLERRSASSIARDWALVRYKMAMPLRLTALKEKKPTVVPFEADENAVTIAPAPKSGRKSTTSLLKGAASLLILI